MRKVLAITAALMIAAVVIMPALGYTNQAAGNQTYSIKAGDKLQNYSLVSMTPAHEMTPEMIVNKFSFQSAGIKSTRVPYTFKSGAAPKYSISLVGKEAATPLGAEAKQAASLGSMNKEETVEPEVVAEVPAVNATEAVAEVPAVNATEAVAEVPAVNATETVAAPVAGPYVIMGIAQDNNQAVLEGWNFDLSKDGAVVDSATSGADGKFNFVGLTAGVYTVSETLKEGWSAVSPVNGTKDITIENASVTDLVFVNQMA